GLSYTGSSSHGFPLPPAEKPCTGLFQSRPAQRLSQQPPGPVPGLPASFLYLRWQPAEVPASVPKGWYWTDPISEDYSHPEAGSGSSLWNCSLRQATFPVRWYRRRSPL